MYTRYYLMVVIAICVPLELYAQSSGTESASKIITAVNASTDSPRIDGRLDDAVWSQVQWTDDFLQKEPVEGGTPSGRTEVAIVFDSDAIYVGARMHSDNPAQVRALVTRRDNETNAEQIAVSLDTYLNRRTAYTFAVTAGGVRIDYYHDEDRQHSTDYSFDPVWTANAEITSFGWTAEMRIPFSQLRFNEVAGQRWGINVNRQIPAKNEDIFWIYVPRDESGWASRFGTLEGLGGIQPRRRLELLPYVASGGILSSDVNQANPFTSEFENDVRAGLDLKMGLGPNMTLDATINPDFGQVEADPAEVNLTAFETFFSERRPFFTEGSDLLGGSHFYSRRIGTSPRGRASGDFVDSPDNTTILGAAKLSGRFASGLSIAALGAATQAEYAQTFDVETNSFGETKIEPFAGYLAVAASQEVGPNASTVGFMATAVQRDIDEDGPVASVLNDEAYSAEVRWNARFRGGAYSFGGSAGGTHVAGTPERILALQRSPVHYYQRPDASYISVDSTRTSLQGYAVDMFGAKNNGNWTGDLFVGIESPGYDPNDIGRLGRADEMSIFTGLQYRETDPVGAFHRYSVGLSQFSSWNFGRNRNSTGVDMFTNATWKNFWYSEIFAGYNPRDFSDTATRGGPRMAIASERNIGTFMRTNSARRFAADLFLFYESDELEREDFRISTEYEWQPNERIEVSVEPGWNRTLGARQYVATRADGPEATFGSRYIFSLIDRTELSAEIRLNYTFSPDLTIELYAEPFAASGNFYRYGELTEAEGIDLRTYGTDGTTIVPDNGGFLVTDGTDSFSIPDRDFNVRSFRSNVVLRWEYRPGSTLFLVWQQDRSGFEPTGEFVRPGTLFNSFTDAGNNFFGLKLSYWLPTG